jgi:hypothetical protein
MSIHSKRAVVGVLLVAVFTIVRIAWPLLRVLARGARSSDFMPTSWEMYSPAIWQLSTLAVVSVVLMGVVFYWLSRG